MSINQHFGCRLIFFIFLTGIHILAFGQKEQITKQADSDDSIIYYFDYSDLLALRIYTNTKWNALNIVKDDNTLKLRPNGPTALGVGFNYKSYGLGIAIGIPKSASSNSKYGKTNRLDLQINVYGKKIGIDAHAQYYKGYYIANPQDFMEWDKEVYPQLPDMEIFALGLNAFYIFNSNKFSYKAAFIRNQVQRKSGGTLTAGIFGQLDMVRTDQGFIPSAIQDSIQVDFDLKSFNTFAFGLTVGYLYTWVISKHFFLNIGVTPGFGLQTIRLETVEGSNSTKNAPAAQLAVRGALGYDSRFFYAGVTGTTIWRNFEYSGYDLDISTEQIKVFIGKRFDLARKRQSKQ